MTAKTIFLNDTDEIIIYNAMFHNDNHQMYMKRNYSSLMIEEYIPILLTKYDHCVIDLSRLYLIGIIYLPSEINKFQKDFFNDNKEVFKKYNLYLNDYLQEGPMLIDEILNIINKKPMKIKEKKLLN